jgi:peptide/nickel transport system substrate-binding protein
MLRLRAGDVDLTTDEIRAEDYASMRRLEEQGTIHLTSAGATISPLALWFNLASEALKADRPWLVSEPFRRAVSHAVDRDAIVDTVYLGAAVPIFGPITPGHGDWFVSNLPRAAYDPGQARALLASAGLRDSDGDGMLEDSRGRAARFSVLTARGDASRERVVALLQEQLRRIGLTVDVVALELGAMIAQWGEQNYDTMLFYAPSSSFEPALDFWLSSGAFHFWNANQPSPATEWEAAIDDLIRRQSATLDAAERRRLFAEAQRTLAEHLPILYFTAPEITIAMSARVRGATPSVLQPPVLWNAEVLSLASGASVSSR